MTKRSGHVPHSAYWGKFSAAWDGNALKIILHPADRGVLETRGGGIALLLERRRCETASVSHQRFCPTSSQSVTN